MEEKNSVFKCWLSEQQPPNVSSLESSNRNRTGCVRTLKNGNSTSQKKNTSTCIPKSKPTSSMSPTDYTGAICSMLLSSFSQPAVTGFITPALSFYFITQKHLQLQRISHFTLISFIILTLTSLFPWQLVAPSSVSSTNFFFPWFYVLYCITSNKYNYWGILTIFLRKKRIVKGSCVSALWRFSKV